MRIFLILLKEYFQKKTKIGLSFKEFYRLKQYGRKDYINGNATLFGKHIRFGSPFWFLHSLDEIFVEQVYKFKPNNDEKLIIDCGANIGLSAIYLKRIFPNSKIIAIEPDQQVFSQLSDNISAFGLTKDVELLQAAAWTENGTLTFLSEGSVGGHLTEATTENPNTVSVQSVRLKDVLEDKNVFFLKIDIEGAEYEVMKDIKDHLQKVDNLFIEYHSKGTDDDHLAEILTWVKNAGFSVYVKEAWNNMSFPFTKQVNNRSGYQMQLNISCFRK